MKLLILRIVVFIIAIFGTLMSLLAYMRIRDKSWLATLSGLGGPGALEQTWAAFIVGGLVAILSIIYIVYSFVKTPKS